MTQIKPSNALVIGVTVILILASLTVTLIKKLWAALAWRRMRQERARPGATGP